MAQTPGSEARTGLKLISPTAVYVILLLAVPLATVLIYSVLTGGRGVVSLPVTIENYAELWSKSVYGYIMLKSLMVALVVTAITVLLAYPVAYFVSFHVKPERKSMWLFLITIPFWTSYLIRVFLWKVILGYNGVINSGLLGLGIISEPLQAINYNVGALIMTLAHAYAPFAILPIFVSLEKIDRSFLEAGQDLGESRLMTFIRVTLPLSMPGVIAAVLIVFIPTAGDYVTPELIGGGKVPMVSNFVETQLLKSRNFAMGSALAATAMFAVAIISVGFILLNKRFLGGRK